MCASSCIRSYITCAHRKIQNFAIFGAKHSLAPMAFKPFTPNFERARTFSFVYVHILDVRGRAPPDTPTFGCVRWNGKSPTHSAPSSALNIAADILGTCTLEVPAPTKTADLAITQIITHHFIAVLLSDILTGFVEGGIKLWVIEVVNDIGRCGTRKTTTSTEILMTSANANAIQRERAIPAPILRL